MRIAVRIHVWLNVELANELLLHAMHDVSFHEMREPNITSQLRFRFTSDLILYLLLFAHDQRIKY